MINRKQRYQGSIARNRLHYGQGSPNPKTGAKLLQKENIKEPWRVADDHTYQEGGGKPRIAPAGTTMTGFPSGYSPW